MVTRMESEFNRVFTQVLTWVHKRTADCVTPELEPLLRRFFEELVRSIHHDPFDDGSVARALRPLLVYLTTSAGRTSANCWATDLFVTEMPLDVDPPDEGLVLDIVWDMGAALHDTVSAPHIADNFFSTPEQLLARLDAWMSAESSPQ